MIISSGTQQKISDSGEGSTRPCQLRPLLHLLLVCFSVAQVRAALDWLLPDCRHRSICGSRCASCPRALGWCWATEIEAPVEEDPGIWEKRVRSQKMLEINEDVRVSFSV